MPSLFSQVWSCCLRGRPISPAAPTADETTRLIPSTHDDPITVQPSITVIDHQKLKDRLGMIVRSKGGKMINVGTPLPFNLHNKALHVQPNQSVSNHSSRSGVRSASGSSGQRATPAGVDQERSASRASSPRRASSPSYTLYPSHEEHDEGRLPILNVRLATDVRIRRGRSRGRQGRFGEERGSEIDQRDSNSSNDAIRYKEEGDEHLVEGKSSSPLSPSPLPELPPKNVSPLDALGHHVPLVQPPTLQIQESLSSQESLPPIQKDFKIKDVGAIARSWRD